jgi:uncharacterized membrane protein
MSDYRIGDYNRGGYIAFMFSMAFTIVFFIYIAFIHPGVDLKEIKQLETKETQVAPTTPAATEAVPAK